MILAVASGKGGTGKTTFAVALALAVQQPVCLRDCDVEAPNTHLFLNPDQTFKEAVAVQVPQIASDKCIRCGECAALCRFNALACLADKVMVFPELCHSCGGCRAVCPVGAITEVDREVGTIESAEIGQIHWMQGRLNIGEAMAPPVISAVKQRDSSAQLTIVDCPPGTSCPMITAVRGSDYAFLVTEPTPFGLHDLKLAVETVRTLGLPCGVILNRADSGDDKVDKYCDDENIEILLRIPESREIAECYSRGTPLTDVVPEITEQLQKLLLQVSAWVEKEGQ